MGRRVWGAWGGGWVRVGEPSVSLPGHSPLPPPHPPTHPRASLPFPLYRAKTCVKCGLSKVHAQALSPGAGPVHVHGPLVSLGMGACGAGPAAHRVLSELLAPPLADGVCCTLLSAAAGWGTSPVWVSVGDTPPPPPTHPPHPCPPRLITPSLPYAVVCPPPPPRLLAPRVNSFLSRRRAWRPSRKFKNAWGAGP